MNVQCKNINSKEIEIKNGRTIEEVKVRLTEVFEDVSYKTHSWKVNIKSIFIGLYNFWKYRKLIYRDRFWDYSFIVDFLVFKLKDMEENWVKNTHYEGDKFTKGRIIILRRRIEDLEDQIDNITSRHLRYMQSHDVSDEERYELYRSMRKEIQVLTDKAYKTFGRNLRNLWD